MELLEGEELSKDLERCAGGIGVGYCRHSASRIVDLVRKREE
jgi:hypothetical protein